MSRRVVLVNSSAPLGEDGFASFYYGTYPRVLRLLVALSASREEAEDVAAEAYTRAFVRWGKVSRLDDPEGWVRRVAMNLGIDQHRRRRRDDRARHFLRPPAAVAGPDSSDVPDIVAALQQLPNKQRKVLVLHYLADRSVEQIAADLGLPVGTVKAQLARGRTALAAAMRDREETGPHV